MTDSSPPEANTDYTFLKSIEEFQQPNSFGRILDAGTGLDTIRWIASLIHAKKATSYTAITADDANRQVVLEETQKLGIENNGEILVGNWFNINDEKEGEDKFSDLCQDEMYDVILVDYLISAMDAFSPYFQDLTVSRLARHLKPNGRLYISEVQPKPDKLPGDNDVFCKIAKIRDACILLSGQRCYREYPLDWVIRNVNKSETGLRVLDVKKIPIYYSQWSTGPNTYEMKVARNMLTMFESKELAVEMEKIIEGLENECKGVVEKSATKNVEMGFDYVVVAEKVDCNHVSRNMETKSDAWLSCGLWSDI